MHTVAYRHIPSMKAVYKVQEGCCFEKVVYDGPEIGFAGIIDRENEEVGPLLCACDPRLAILIISEQEFLAIRQTVYDRLAA